MVAYSSCTFLAIILFVTTVKVASTSFLRSLASRVTISQGINWRPVGEPITDKSKRHKYPDPPQVAISGDGTRAVFGATWDYNTIGPAVVKTFDFLAGKWKETGIFPGTVEDQYGFTIALSKNGNRLAIGAMTSNDDGLTNNGRVEIYKFTKKSGWTLLGKKLTGKENYARFGSSIAISEGGNRVAIGSENSVSIFDFDGINWAQIGQTLQGEDADDSDGFGTSVTMSYDGNVVAVGAPYSDTSKGYVKVFQYKNLQWAQLGGKMSGKREHVEFGLPLTMNAWGDIVAIGTVSKHGYVSVFQYKDGIWNPMGKHFKGELMFGIAVSLAADIHRIAVGPYDETGGNVTIFEYNGEAWDQIGEKLPAPPSEIFFGAYLSLSGNGNRLSIASVYEDGRYQNGRLSIFDL